MRKYYLAVDIGASSGRHILSWLEEGRICVEEVHRFENGMKRKNGHLCWDTDQLFEEILRGMAVCKQQGRIPVSMGIDTWAVDFVLLDKEGKRIGDAVGYRDERTKGMDQKVSESIAPEELYQRTGIQKQTFNTIYQLMAVKMDTPQLMEQAESLLLIPDYFNYRLTGKRRTEYTNATTTQLVNLQTGDWDTQLIQRLGYPEQIFPPITMAGTLVGSLTKEIQDRVGFDVEVVQTASHDTAAAVLAVPARAQDFLYISSGTWSLMGVEQRQPNCSKAAQSKNFTNEGGYEYRYRFLKNIMGLWMIQSVRHELQDEYSFAKLCSMAEECGTFPSRVDVNEDAFLAPHSMIEAIQESCRNTGQQVPRTAGEIAAVVYNSLAESYGETVRELEEITGRTYEVIHIVGGGANADYLNQLTAKATKKTVYSGPTEATSVGNIVVQMMRRKEFESLEDARRAIHESFPIKCFKSQQGG